MRKMLTRILLVLTGIAFACILIEGALRVSGYSTRVLNFTRLGRDREFNPLPGIRYLYKGHSSYTQSWPDPMAT